MLILTLPLLLIMMMAPSSVCAETIVRAAAPRTCLEVPGGLKAPGVHLKTGTCHGDVSQAFAFPGGGEIRFGGLCLDADSGRGRDGDAVILFLCHGGANQKWTLTAEGEIRGVKDKCVTFNPDGRVNISSCRGRDDQKWRVSGEAGDATQAAASASPTVADPACAPKTIRISEDRGLKIWSPDGERYLQNKDDAQGVMQVYVGGRNGGAPACVSCGSVRGAPEMKKFKMQAHWHPSGEWIVLAVEQEKFDKPLFATRDMVEGWLQSGIWVDMFAVRPDGSDWHRLVDFGSANKADGFTGVAFTPDGKQGAWAEIVDGNIFKYSFGQWRLIIADFVVREGVPALVNRRDITPPDTFWVEPGNFSANGHDLLLSADTGFADHRKAEGQDQYILDIRTGAIRNLTNSPAIWDEHGVFSPDGRKIFFMSSLPYPKNSSVFNLKTEFMLMNADGSDIRQLTQFNDKTSRQYTGKDIVAANGEWDADGRSVHAMNLIFPKYESWDIMFQGNCGARF